MKNPVEMDDLGVPLFLETPIYTPAKYSLLILLLSSHVAPLKHLTP